VVGLRLFWTLYSNLIKADICLKLVMSYSLSWSRRN